MTLSGSGEIRYTLDGSEPGQDSPLYEGPISIEDTTILRAISTEPGTVHSDILTESYIFTEPRSLPVLSLVTDPEGLWGDNGIYVSSWSRKDVEIPAHISYYGPDGTFSTDCGVNLHGSTSVLVSQKKSFTLRFRDVYGGPLKFDIFGDGRITEFSSLLLRASVESTFSSMMRDDLMGYVAAGSSDAMLSMNYRYAVLYLNGEYWGIYSIREHYTEKYYADHMGFPADSTSIVREYGTPKDSLYDIREWIRSHDLSDPENYAYVSSLLDTESFADWAIFEAYTGNIDVNGNMRYFYSSADGLWRCALCDVDLGFFDTACFRVPTEALWHGAFIRGLMQNAAFRELLLRRMGELLSGPLSDREMCDTVDLLASQLRPEVEEDTARWGGSLSYWEGLVTELKDFCTGRAAKMIDDIRFRFGLTAAEVTAVFGEGYT